MKNIVKRTILCRLFFVKRKSKVGLKAGRRHRKEIYTFDIFRCFKTVADQGSFRKLADILGLTPSAISHTISAMESELGFSVLNRSKSGVTLTNYGEHLLPYVNAVLNSDEMLMAGNCRI